MNIGQKELLLLKLYGLLILLIITSCNNNKGALVTADWHGFEVDSSYVEAYIVNLKDSLSVQFKGEYTGFSPLYMGRNSFPIIKLRNVKNYNDSLVIEVEEHTDKELILFNSTSKLNLKKISEGVNYNSSFDTFEWDRFENQYNLRMINYKNANNVWPLTRK